MSDKRSITSSQTNQGNGNGNKKNFQRPRDPIGIEDLRGYYYVYGKTTQAEAYHRTTRAIADYAAQNIDSGKEMYRLIMDGTETTYGDPEDLGKEATPGQVAVYKMLYAEARKDRLQYANDKFKVFRLIMGQCTTTMRQKLEAITDYKDMEFKSDVAALLETMKQLVYSTKRGQHTYWVMQAQFKKLALMQQKPNESLEKFDKIFDEQLKVTEQQWGKPIPYKLRDETEAIQLEERNQFIACLFLGSVDRGRY
jgi:hypothetical protein